jgi:thioredoxin-like negative regulator of GroEL
MSGQSGSRKTPAAVDDDTAAAWLSDQSEVCAVVVTAAWCAQSQELAPVVEQLAARYPVATIDFDEAPEFAATHNVTGVPTVLVFRAGEPVDTVAGCPQVESWPDMIAEAVGRAL